MSYFSYQTAIAYRDVGLDGCLSHRGVLRLLQEAASVASDQCGYGLKDSVTKGVGWMLTAWRLELVERPFWPCPLEIHTWPRTLDGFFSDRDFEVFAMGQRIARATSRWMLVNLAAGHAARITPEVAAAYSLDERVLFDTPIITTARPSPEAEETFTHIVGRRDIDTNHHVNNLHYLDYAMEALPEDVWDNLPPTVEILYRKQIRLGASISCRYLCREGRHHVEIHSDQSRTPHAFLWFS